MSYYRMNDAHKGIEVIFDSKPSAETREALKNQGFRWNKTGGYWYAKQSAERVELAKSLTCGELASCSPAANAEDVAANMSEFYTIASDGYLGATELTGSLYASGKRLYGAELSKAIRETLKRCGLKGCSVRVKTFSGGQSIDVTARANASDILTETEYVRELERNGDMLGYLWYTDADGKHIHKDAMPWTDDEKCKAIMRNTASKEYAWKLRELKSEYSGLGYRKDDPIFREGFKARIDNVQRILDAFNHDDSNGMVDYFDRHFYDDIYIKIAG